MKYCNSLSNYSRFKTREVKVGNIGIGNNNPISVQSMTITDTMNTESTVDESIRMIESGCELVSSWSCQAKTVAVSITVFQIRTSSRLPVKDCAELPVAVRPITKVSLVLSQFRSDKVSISLV